MVSTLLKLLSVSLLPLAFTTPISNHETASTSTMTTAACPTALYPAVTDSYFYLKTRTISNKEVIGSSSPKDNLYLTGYHVEAGSSVAVLEPKSEATVNWVAYLNDTFLQIGTEVFVEGPPLFSYLLFPENDGEVATAMMIEVFGGPGGAGGSFLFNDTDSSGRKGLKADADLFVGWMACDWFGTAGNVQLIPQFERYWEGGDVDGLKPDGVLPSNCEAVELVREDICCE